MTNDIKISMSVSRKVNLGNYESADAFLSLSDVPVGATAEEINAAIVTSKIVFDALKDEIVAKTTVMRGGGMK